MSNAASDSNDSNNEIIIHINVFLIFYIKYGSSFISYFIVNDKGS